MQNKVAAHRDLIAAPIGKASKHGNQEGTPFQDVLAPTTYMWRILWPAHRLIVHLFDCCGFYQYQTIRTVRLTVAKDAGRTVYILITACAIRVSCAHLSGVRHQPKMILPWLQTHNKHFRVMPTSVVLDSAHCLVELDAWYQECATGTCTCLWPGSGRQEPSIIFSLFGRTGSALWWLQVYFESATIYYYCFFRLSFSDSVSIAGSARWRAPIVSICSICAGQANVCLPFAQNDFATISMTLKKARDIINLRMLV